MPPKKKQFRLSREKLRALIEDATVDAYDESEQASGFYTMMEDNLQVPFTTEILGFEVKVECVDITGYNAIHAICERNGKRQRIPILELPLPDPPPEGAEWIEAYRRWCSGDY